MKLLEFKYQLSSEPLAAKNRIIDLLNSLEFRGQIRYRQLYQADRWLIVMTDQDYLSFDTVYRPREIFQQYRVEHSDLTVSRWLMQQNELARMGPADQKNRCAVF